MIANDLVLPKFHLEENSLGQLYQSEFCTAFFGNSLSDTPEPYKFLPGVSFHFMNQIHSNKVANVSISDLYLHGKTSFYTDANNKVDAHFTSVRGVALCVRTADCIPVLLYSPTDRVIAAVHAGWRGIEQEILVQTMTKLLVEGYLPQNFYALIGPHIRQESFEVSKDVGMQLQSAYIKVRTDQRASILHPHGDPTKNYVDLTTIAKAQLCITGIPEKQIQTLNGDTFTSKDFHSFRRDREKSGRQISLILLK